MYLNATSESKSQNKVIDVKDGIAIIQHAHFNDRYTSRVRPICDATGNRYLTHHNLLTYAVKTVKNNMDKIVTKDGKFTQNLINYQLYVILNGKKVMVEMTILVTSSLAKFDYHHPTIVNDEFKTYYNKGIIAYRKPVVCIETILTTLRTDDEPRIAYSDYSDEHVLDTIRVKTFKTIDGEIFKDMTAKVRKFETMQTAKVVEFVNSL